MDDKNKTGVNEDAGGEFFSWVIIVILLAAFWPIGLIMLLRKLRYYAVAAPKKQSTASRAKTHTVKKEKKLLRTVLLIVSAILLAVGLSTLTDCLRDIVINGYDGYTAWDLITGSFYTLGGAVCLGTRRALVKRQRQYAVYRSVIAERESMKLEEIADACGVTVKRARRDVSNMILAGYFGQDAYIDNSLGCFVRSASVAFREAKKREAVQPEKDNKTDIKDSKPSSRYMDIINELRTLNAAIADILISDKIGRIEHTTAKIFREVEQNPEKLPQIRRFMNYYLPTTLKLLRSYATLERQGAGGDNIQSAKQNINDILDTLTLGFGRQLDLLFESDVIDISADINVLENMMQQDYAIEQSE